MLKKQATKEVCVIIGRRKSSLEQNPLPHKPPKTPLQNRSLFPRKKVPLLPKNSSRKCYRWEISSREKISHGKCPLRNSYPSEKSSLFITRAMELDVKIFS